MWRKIKACLYSCAEHFQGNWLGWQRWLILDATFAQPTPSLYGLTAIQKLMALGSINALNAVLLAPKTWLRLTILKNQLCVAISADHGCF